MRSAVVVSASLLVLLVGARGEDDKMQASPTNGGRLYSTEVRDCVATF
jgi:hypothetical protein